jgi:hypothetical protein
MRLWLVPFCELDRDRVYGQHYEYHTILNSVVQRGMKWRGWELPEHRADLLQQHHNIVTEAAIRGYNFGLHHVHTLDEIVDQESKRIMASVLQKAYPKDFIFDTAENEQRSKVELKWKLPVLDWERFQLLVRWSGVWDFEEKELRWDMRFKGRQMIDPDSWDYAAGLYDFYFNQQCPHSWMWEDMPAGTERCLLCKHVGRYKQDRSTILPWQHIKAREGSRVTVQ